MNYISRAAKETVSSRDRELDVMRRKLLDSGDELNAVLKLKDATVRDNTQLRDELDRVRLDNKVRESLLKLPVRKCLFSSFGRCLQCQHFVTDRGKAVSFPTLKGLIENESNYKRERVW